VAAEDGDDLEQAKLEYPLYLGGAGYWDEHHRQVRIRRDNSGKSCASGELPPGKL